MIITSSCDQGYFPLVKGLVLSLLDAGLPDNVQFVFLDMGCNAESLGWFRERGIEVVRLDEETLGELGAQRYGYHRAQICRPFLPRLFPQAKVLAWLDCDAWAQDISILDVLRQEALDNPDHILVCPEIHHTYTPVHADANARHKELAGYYQEIYGAELADKMSTVPTVNSGFFAMHRDNALWEAWQQEIISIYRDNYDSYDAITRHFGEQMSLNKLIFDGAPVRYFDPLYNYLCLWTPPHRDDQGIVRLSAPPYPPIGVLHLAGGWKYFGQDYYNRGLLYRNGEYLDANDRALLFPEAVSEGFR